MHKKEQASDALDRVVSIIEASWRGRLPAEVQRPEWYVFHISPAQFLELRRRLGDSSTRLLSYFDNDLRFDYDPDRALLVLRLMACALHEYMKDSVCSSIYHQLRQIANDTRSSSRLQELGSSIRSLGHSTVDLQARRATPNEARARKSPDGQYRFLTKATGHQPAYFIKSPPFIIEVGYSQDAEELEQLAKDYYEQSNGKIKTVLTINTSTCRVTNDHTAKLCLYRGPERVCHDMAFCNADGEAVEGCLNLYLADFIPDSVLDGLDRSLYQASERTRVQLPFEDLCEQLREAMLAQDAEDEMEAEDV